MPASGLCLARLSLDRALWDAFAKRILGRRVSSAQAQSDDRPRRKRRASAVVLAGGEYVQVSHGGQPWGSVMNQVSQGVSQGPSQGSSWPAAAMDGSFQESSGLGQHLIQQGQTKGGSCWGHHKGSRQAGTKLGLFGGCLKLPGCCPACCAVLCSQ